MKNQDTTRIKGKSDFKVSQLPGQVIILSAPSGAGKTTLRRAALSHFSGLVFSVSYTTRKPRTGERAGVDYHFIEKPEFEDGISEGRWVEWAEVHGYYYGTSAEFLKQNLAAGNDVLLEIDVQGTRKLLGHYPQSITIFITPPSLAVLEKRLESRGTDSAQTIALRLANAKIEMEQKDLYRHVIINDRLDDAITDLIQILEKYLTSGKELKIEG